MAPSPKWPLLREAIGPAPTPLPRKEADVLNDAGILIVGLFDEEAVVLNRKNRLSGEGGGQKRHCEVAKSPKQAPHSGHAQPRSS